MTGGIAQLASGIADELRLRLPGQRKTQREALALLVATMLEARTANLMTLAAFYRGPQSGRICAINGLPGLSTIIGSTATR